MNANDLQEALARIEEQLRGHVDRYERDRQETKDDAAEDRLDRDKWRINVDDKIDSLDKKIQPVLRDHQLIIRGGKWVLGSAAAIWGMVKAWFLLKDHLR